jgi:hypothetical protein
MSTQKSTSGNPRTSDPAMLSKRIRILVAGFGFLLVVMGLEWVSRMSFDEIFQSAIVLVVILFTDVLRLVFTQRPPKGTEEKVKPDRLWVMAVGGLIISTIAVPIQWCIVHLEKWSSPNDPGKEPGAAGDQPPSLILDQYGNPAKRT